MPLRKSLWGRRLAAAFVGLLVTQQFIVFIFTTALYFHLLIALLVVIAWPSWKPRDRSEHASPCGCWSAVGVIVLLLFVRLCGASAGGDHAFAEASDGASPPAISPALRPRSNIVRCCAGANGSDVRLELLARHAAGRRYARRFSPPAWRRASRLSTRAFARSAAPRIVRTPGTISRCCWPNRTTLRARNRRCAMPSPGRRTGSSHTGRWRGCWPFPGSGE